MNNVIHNKIIFDSVKIKNFLSIGQEMEFNFKKHEGMNYVFGKNKDSKDDVKNGSGKSVSFSDSILFGLFGRTSKKINKPNVVNRNSGKNCLIELKINVNEDNYIIKNGVHPTFCHLIKNGKDITKSSIKETQDFISNEIIKSTFDIFKNSIILTVNDTTSIFEMSKNDKREFIERIFNLSIFGSMYSLVKNDLKDLEKEILEEQSNHNKLEKDIKEFRKRLKTFDRDKENEIKDINKKILKITNKIEKLDCDDEILIKKYEETISKCENSNNKLKLLVDTDIRVESLINELQKDISYSEESINKYADILEIICNQCNIKLNEIFKIDETKEKVEYSFSEIEKNERKSEKIKNSIDKLKELEERLELKIEKLKRKQEKIRENKNEVRYLNEKIEDLKGFLKMEENKISPFQELIEKYQNETDICYKKLKEKIENKQHLDYLVYALSEEGVKKYIISKLINVLNNRIRKYLDILGADNFTVVFDPNFDVTFLTTTGECEYGNFSAGEKRRIDISTIFAFRDVLCGQGTLLSSVLVADELLDVSIDQTAIDGVIKILKNETEKGQTVFLMSHKECIEELQDDFNNVIELEKQGGFTKIISDPQGGIG